MINTPSVHMTFLMNKKAVKCGQDRKGYVLARYKTNLWTEVTCKRCIKAN